MAPGSSVAVVGCGGIGLAAVQGARLVGASPIIAVDIADDKLERARSVGATHTVNARDVDAVAAVRELTSGGVDYSFEAIGTGHIAFALRPGAGDSLLCQRRSKLVVGA